MLSIRNLEIQYKQNKPAVWDFSLDVNPGEIVGIVGESGSGKTSVIRGIMGLLSSGGKIVHGDILLGDKSLKAFSHEEWRKFRGTEISMIFQDSGAIINPIRRIKSQYIEYIRTHEKISKKAAFTKAVEMLEKMQLPNGENIMNCYSFQLSGGMRQRVGIAMAMTFQPRILLADEPTSALDVTTQAQIVKQMMALRRDFNTSIIVVTHNLGVAAYMADKIVVMKEGRIVDCGTAEEILHNPCNEYTKELLASVPTLDGERYV
ncbi:MAG: ABC transporter ATP-binding protein [Clostridiales bacterium]